MSVWLELIGILALGLLSRIPFLRFRSSDLWHHLWLMRFYQREGSLAHREVRGSVVPGYVAYPPLPHMLIARMPERFWTAAGEVGNVGYDLLSLVVVYWVSREIFAGSSLDAALPGVSAAAACALVWATAPILHPTNARLRAVGGRTLGNLLVLLYAVGMYGAVAGGAPMLLVACVGLGVLILLSSQFAMQALVVLSLGLALAYVNVVPVLTLLAIGAVAWYVKPLGLRRQLQGKLEHYRWYLRQLREGRIEVPGQPSKAWERLKGAVTRPRLLPHFVLNGFGPSVLVLNAPGLVLLVALAAANEAFLGTVAGSPPLFFALVAGASLAAAAVLTSIGPLVVFGQPERYVEYGVPAVAVLVVGAVTMELLHASAVLYLLLFHFGMIFANLGYLSFAPKGAVGETSKSGQFGDLVKFLEELEPRRVITLPTKLNSALGYYLYDRHQFYYYPLVFSEADGVEYGREDERVYNYLRPDLRHFARKYGVDTLVVTTADVPAYRRRMGELQTEGARRLFQNDGYEVLDLSHLSESVACHARQAISN